MPSYLSCRKQSIVEKKIHSSMQDVKSGVPQGSTMIIGPVLLLIFIYDIPLFINEAYVEVYADDSTVQAANKDAESQKLLGVIIDRTLSWDKQIDSVCLNITRRIILLKLLSKDVDQLSLKQYYNLYILPIFYYGCMIWSQCTPNNMNRQSKLQKRAPRIIL